MTGTDAAALAEIHQRLAACTQAGDARKAQGYAACFTRDGVLELVTSAAGLDHNGYYVDKLRREDGQWLIAHRRPRTLWISPDSVLHRKA